MKRKSNKNKSSMDKDDLERIVTKIMTPWNLNRKEQPQMHIPKDFVNFRFRMEDKEEEKALNRVLDEAVVYVNIFRSAREKWRNLMKAHHAKIQKRKSNFSPKWRV